MADNFFDEKPDFDELLRKIKEANQPEPSPKAGCIKALFKFLFLFPVGVTLGILNVLMISFTVVTIWGWLIEPFINWTPQFMLVVGSLVAWLAFSMKPNIYHKDYKPKTEDMFIIFFAVLIGCCMFLLYGWIFSFFV